MRFSGEWLQCDDGIVRTIIRAEVLTGDDSWRAFELIVNRRVDVVAIIGGQHHYTMTL